MSRIPITIAAVLVGIVAYSGVTAFTGNPHLAPTPGELSVHSGTINELLQRAMV